MVEGKGEVAILKAVADRILGRVLAGSADKNVRFEDLRRLLKSLGFEERVKGSHHVFYKSGVEEILNLQPRGASAKPYQLKQVRNDS